MPTAAEPRIKARYHAEVAAKLKEEFGYTSAMQIPRLQKVVINMGVGDAIQNIKVLDVAVDELTAIAGQKAVVRKAKKSVAQFKLRAGMPIACMVTLRGNRMWEFLDRLMTLSPRISPPVPFLQYQQLRSLLLSHAPSPSPSPSPTAASPSGQSTAPSHTALGLRVEQGKVYTGEEVKVLIVKILRHLRM